MKRCPKIWRNKEKQRKAERSKKTKVKNKLLYTPPFKRRWQKTLNEIEIRNLQHFQRLFTKTLKIRFLTDHGQIIEGAFDIKMHQEKEEAAKLYLCGITAEQLVKSVVLYYELLDRCIDRGNSELIQMRKDSQ